MQSKPELAKSRCYPLRVDIFAHIFTSHKQPQGMGNCDIGKLALGLEIAGMESLLAQTHGQNKITVNQLCSTFVNFAAREPART